MRRLLAQGYGGALLMEPRTGKTKTTIDWLSALNQMGRVRRAVIVAPNRVMGVWLTELLKESPRRVHVWVWDAKSRREGLPPEPQGYDLYILIVNYEAFATPGKKTPSGRAGKSTGRYKTRSLILKWLGKDPGAMVLDESHKIKSPSGKAANMLVTMGPRFKYRAILTGTPITKEKRTFDIYMQWKFLNPDRFKDLSTLGSFKDRYGRWTNQNGFPQFLGPRNLGELHRRMSEDAYIIRRDQCFDLPPREDLVEYVDLKGSRPVYEQMAAEMIAILEDGSIAEASLRIVQALRLSQITSGFVTADDGTVRRLGFEKFERLAELVGERIEQSQKVVIAARWKADLDLAEQLGEELGVPTYAIRGKVKRADSDRYIREFREVAGPALIVVQPAAASLGIDLSSASFMVWYSHTPSWTDFTQCCDRIALSRTSTTFVHLVARRSVDEMLLDTLAGDGDIARAVMTRPGELLEGHPLNLDDHSRLRGIGSFQYRKRGKA
jgi:SNF2 family DNA or RNA helicase